MQNNNIGGDLNMRKKISVHELSLGMYIDELCGHWIDHPFWKTSFKLESNKNLVELLHSGISEVWIDTAKGLDIAAACDMVTAADDNRQTEMLLQQGIAQTQAVQTRVPVEQELVRAKKIHSKARLAIVTIFEEGRHGKSLPLKEVTALIEEICHSVSRNPSAMLSLIRLKNKDDYTYLHCVAVGVLMIALGKQMGIAEDTLRFLGMAGLLHDVGKMAVPSEILNKPGRLTDQEFAVIKTHPVSGWEMLSACADVDNMVLDVCLHHHERMDGTGYPDRLSGETLSLFARMGAVCDVYDAITSNRSYKDGWEPAVALRRMAEWQDGHLDTVVFQAFVKTVGIYPVGSLLKLKSGRLAVVVDQTSERLLQPLVKVFFSIRSNTAIPVEMIDLSRSHDSIESVEDAVKWGLDIPKMAGVG